MRAVNHSSRIHEVRQTEVFQEWFSGLKDMRARRRIAQRIARLQSGLMGDVKYFKGIGELRIDQGPGYRVYFVKRGSTLIILLSGGDKSTQKHDIKRAMEMAKEI